MKTPKTILILGANAGQLDLINHMNSMGWKTVACSYRTGEAGQDSAAEFHQVDILDIDAVTNLAKKVSADLVFSVSSDVAMTSSVKVSENLSLPHFYSSELIDLFNKKQKLRSHLNNNKISEVGYIEVDSTSQGNSWNDFPCMVKPTDSQGQRGVQKIYQKSEMQEALKIAIDASNSSTAIIEEFLDGIEISCNVLVVDGNIVFNVLSERLVHEGDLAGIPRGHVVPCAHVSEQNQENALDVVSATIKSLNIINGCLYFQMIVTENGVKIIEIAPRLDGCHVWRVIKAATGRDFLAETVNCLLGNTQNMKPVSRLNNNKYELMFQQMQPNKLFKQDKFPIPNNSLYHEYRYQDGQKIFAVNGKLEVVGYYVRQYD